MNCEIVQINYDTWRVEDNGVRFFLLAGTEHAMLIDSGMTVHNARDIATSLTSLPLTLLNTHADMDHMSNPPLTAIYGEGRIVYLDYSNCFQHDSHSGKLNIPMRSGQAVNHDVGQIKEEQA